MPVLGSIYLADACRNPKDCLFNGIGSSAKTLRGRPDTIIDYGKTCKGDAKATVKA